MTDAAEDDRAAARRINRRTWILLGLVVVVFFGVGRALGMRPDFLGEILGNLFGAACFIGIGAYFVVGGARALRLARASSVAAWLIVLGVAPALFVAQRLEQKRDAERLVTMVKTMGSRIAQADRDYAAWMEKFERASPLDGFGPRQVTDAAARRATRDSLAGAIGAIDELLARRERVLAGTMAEIEAARVSEKAKAATLAGLRETSGKVPLSVQLVKALRALLAKAAEVVAHLDLNAANLALRDGQIEFSDSAAAARFNALQDELAALAQALERVRQQTKK